MTNPRKVYSYAPSDPKPVSSPRCSGCSTRMDLTRISPDVGGRVVQHFVCPKCHLTVGVSA